ncbi:glycoside hydrolase family 47 protein [Pluteus cervinus]|uniref:Glycoside hydrolase family 47 protein n=1 Tax=Pluteus cervinus TaxID=181527 RepID=A0ACD3B746_9AGAR|nr:glycoside hydrolase family 47 protein [Pluteus cervinus]
MVGIRSRRSLRRLAVAGTALLYPYATLAGPVQHPGLSLPDSAAANKQAVVDIFTKSYEAYRSAAFGHDDLAPISNTSVDSRNGWGASIVDALSTMHVMGLNDYFTEGVNFASKIDFSNSQTPSTVSVFETTIRYLGGLLSAYELSGEQYPALLTKAQQLADKLAWAWVGTNDVPYGFLDFSSNTPSVSSSNIAEAGTLALEWGTLSQHTGNSTYQNLAAKSLKHIANLGSPLPGLAAQGIDPTSGQPVGSYVTWGGGSDSYFEYLIKYARLFPNEDSIYRDTWLTAVDSSIKTLLRTSTVGNHVYLADYDGSRIRHVSSHLACFHGGNWIFGGKLLNNDTIVQHALDLVDACWNTYAGTVTGIGPEAFAFISSDGNYTGSSGPSRGQQTEYQQNGFYTTTGYYILRPEVLESNFYAWRATGDTKYLDRAASAIDSFNKYLRVGVAFAGIGDVTKTSSGYYDDMESFWFAEVLKYLYLTFDDPAKISLDEYIFNTEAHPFKLPSTPSFNSAAIRANKKSFTPVSDGPLPAVSGLTSLPQFV